MTCRLLLSCTARWRPPLLLPLFAAFALPATAQEVACHYTYGGETKTIIAAPVASPYRVPTIEIGSYFRFRVVFQTRPRDIAAIRVYTYADGNEGPVLIHQASYPYPPAAASGATPGYGFSGRQFVYETMRDGELQYWCELAAPRRTTRRAK